VSIDHAHHYPVGEWVFGSSLVESAQALVVSMIDGVKEACPQVASEDPVYAHAARIEGNRLVGA